MRMHLRQRLLAVAWATFLALALRAQSPSLTAIDAGRIMAEVPTIQNVLLSPNGEWVVYGVVRRTIATNAKTTELLLQRVTLGSEPLAEPIPIPPTATGIRWCPDSDCLTMNLSENSQVSRGPRGFVRYGVRTKSITAIPVRDSSSL